MIRKLAIIASLACGATALAAPGGLLLLGVETRVNHIVLTSGSNAVWNVPTDWNSNNNLIECIGGGGGSEGVGGPGSQGIIVITY